MRLLEGALCMALLGGVCNLCACKSGPNAQAQQEIREAQQQTNVALNTTQEAIKANAENQNEYLSQVQAEINDTERRIADLTNQRREIDERVGVLTQRRAEAAQQMEAYRVSNGAQLQSARASLEQAMLRLRQAYQVASAR